MAIYCAADLHGNWGPLAHRAKHFQPGDWLLLLGDLDLVRPLSHMVFPLVDRGVHVRWVAGNHDFEAEPQSVEFLRGGQSLGWELHCTTEIMDGLRVAGLSGIYDREFFNRPYPYDKRERHLRGGELPRHLMATIFQEDIDALLALGDVDVIVSHECPFDYPELEMVASSMNCRLWVHGHHHIGREDIMANGGTVKCLTAERPWKLKMPDTE